MICTMLDFSKIIGFEWDKGNLDKNLIKHNVVNNEAEEVFASNPIVLPNIRHSRQEKRYFCLGQTNKGRKLYVSLTVRSSRIRIISARDMSRKERKSYEQKKLKTNT